MLFPSAYAKGAFAFASFPHSSNFRKIPLSIGNPNVFAGGAVAYLHPNADKERYAAINAREIAAASAMACLCRDIDLLLEVHFSCRALCVVCQGNANALRPLYTVIYFDRCWDLQIYFLCTLRIGGRVKRLGRLEPHLSGAQGVESGLRTDIADGNVRAAQSLFSAESGNPTGL